MDSLKVVWYIVKAQILNKEISGIIMGFMFCYIWKVAELGFWLGIICAFLVGVLFNSIIVLVFKEDVERILSGK